MEFGSFMEFPPVAAAGESAAFDQALAEVQAADEYGLDAVWLAELHGAPERSVLSAPMMVASAIAACTSRVKIGIAVQVLPLSHPLRLAEEAATVDQISHGRLIYGIGRSGVVRTYEDYGISYGESRERFAETLEILKLAWTEAQLFLRGQVSQLQQCRGDAQAVPEALSRTAHGGGDPGNLPADRPARAADLCRGAPGAVRATRPSRIKSYREAYADGRSSRPRPGVSARPGLSRRDARAGPRRSRRTAS